MAQANAHGCEFDFAENDAALNRSWTTHDNCTDNYSNEESFRLECAELQANNYGNECSYALVGETYAYEFNVIHYCTGVSPAPI